MLCLVPKTAWVESCDAVNESLWAMFVAEAGLRHFSYHDKRHQFEVHHLWRDCFF